MKQLTPDIVTAKEGSRAGKTFITLDNGSLQEVTYFEKNGLAVFEGDMVLGTVEEVEAYTQLMREMPGKPAGQRALKALFTDSIWPGGVVYFEIDSALPNPQRVGDAIRHWEERTPIRFVPRTDQQAYIVFTVGDGCMATLGYRGTRQLIWLGANCSVGNTIHEIGHALGLRHEQCRADRDQFIRVLYENIITAKRSQFDIYHDERLARYDIASIMQYSAYAFSNNGKKTIESLFGEPFGQRNGLSTGDIMATWYKYHWNKRPVTDLTVISGSTASIEAPPGFFKIPQDLNDGAGGKYVFLCYRKDPEATEFVTDIRVIVGRRPGMAAPEGFCKIEQDTNAGAGGRFVYICYKKSERGAKVLNVAVLPGDPLPGYAFTRCPQNLNEGTRGRKLFLSFQPEKTPITNLAVVEGRSDLVPPPPGFYRETIDLNKGARGKYVYICYAKEDDAEPITGLAVISGSSSNIQPPPGYVKVPGNLNAGTRGNYIYLCYTKDPGRAVLDIACIAGKSALIPASPGYTKIDVDLNEGAGGNYVFVSYLEG